MYLRHNGFRWAVRRNADSNARAIYVVQLDQFLSELASGWNVYSTAIGAVIVLFAAYPLLTSRDPDYHPLLLARQSAPSGVRQPGESAIYRSPDVPHGYPLKTGLGVKDSGAPRWSMGRNGDVRDIWRQAARGVLDDNGQPTGQKGKLLTVFGKEDVIEHDLDDVSKQINIVGQHFQKQGSKRVAIYLPNSVELLATIFASFFYGLKPILLPFNQSTDILVKLLNESKADTLVAAAGVFSLTEVGSRCPKLKYITWVVEPSSRHMDFDQTPQSLRGEVDVAVWHSLVDSRKATATSELPANKEGEHLESLGAFWKAGKDDVGKLVEYSQSNIISATAANISALPPRQRMTPSDLFLPVDSLSLIYPLTLTFAALFSNASVALNSAAEPGTDIALAARSIAPTIIAAAPETAVETHRRVLSQKKGVLQQLGHRSKKNTLAEGRMPGSSLVGNFLPTDAIGTTPGQLRLIYVSERCYGGAPPLPSQHLSDLRIFTGARVIYALTAAEVAGAVAQTHYYDYRREEHDPGSCSHFGVPLSSLEIKLKDTPFHKTTDDGLIQGEIIVSGPSVVGGEASLNAIGKIRDDNTLAYTGGRAWL